MDISACNAQQQYWSATLQSSKGISGRARKVHVAQPPRRHVQTFIEIPRKGFEANHFSFTSRSRQLGDRVRFA